MANKFVLSNSANAVGATQSSIKTQRAIEGISAVGALSALSTSGVNLPTPVIAPGIPSADAMTVVANAVVKAATDLEETAIYNTYVSVFDTIKSIAQSGNYYYELTMSEQQKSELTPVLSKYGYRIELVNNQKHNTVIRWGSVSVLKNPGGFIGAASAAAFPSIKNIVRGSSST
jgi:hypothetical protein